MIRVLLVILCVAFFCFALWGMRIGWRHRAARQSDLAPLPLVPSAVSDSILGDLEGVYVGSTYAGRWQDRIAAQGLGIRSNATASLSDAGVLIDREGAPAIFIPTESIIDAHLAPGLAGKVVGAGGLLVIRWRLGAAELDTGLRGDDKSAYPQWVRTITERLKATHE
jgi:hypothetical protein